MCAVSTDLAGTNVGRVQMGVQACKVTGKGQTTHRVFIHIVCVIWVPADVINWGQDIVKVLQGAHQQEGVKL